MHGTEKKDVSDNLVSNSYRADLRLETSCNVVKVPAFGASLHVVKLLLGFSLTFDCVVMVVNCTGSGQSVPAYH